MFCVLFPDDDIWNGEFGNVDVFADVSDDRGLASESFSI